MLEGLLTVIAPYVGLAAAYYTFILYPIVWFRRHYRVRIVRRARA